MTPILQVSSITTNTASCRRLSRLLALCDYRCGDTRFVFPHTDLDNARNLTRLSLNAYSNRTSPTDWAHRRFEGRLRPTSSKDAPVTVFASDFEASISGTLKAALGSRLNHGLLLEESDHSNTCASTERLMQTPAHLKSII